MAHGNGLRAAMHALEIAGPRDFPDHDKRCAIEVSGQEVGLAGALALEGGERGGF